ncbi:unnamed protein product [Mytilus edulis]|uniref:Apple domain-containing protein n=1 Tax=Mytilus edulis TaxID=6550 RepID=A0A8S3SPC9_MYTED|nr:unnamed protein product [Mytilus edulis]
MTVWTIHKVNNETPKGTRSYENLPYTIEYNLDDHESVLCVYFVYEGLKFSGWVADDCKNETVVHLVLCTDKSYGITAFPKLTFLNEEVDWTYSEKYCDYTYYSDLIELFEQVYFVTLFQDSRKLTITSDISFWSEPNSEEYRKYTSVVVFDESVCQSCHGEISYFLPSSEFLLPDGLLFIDCTKIIDAMMCEHQTDLKLFVEMSSVIIVNKVSLKNISVSSTVECEEQCIALTTYGINCAGFNYNWKLQECSLLAYLEDCKCSSFILSETEGMSAFLVQPYSITVRESNPITIDIPRVSPELRIQDNDDNDSTVTDSQASTLVETATTTKPSSTVGDNVAASTLVERATTTKPSSTAGDNAAEKTGTFKPIHQSGSTEIRIQDKDNTDPMVTNQQPSTLAERATTKPSSTVGDSYAATTGSFKPIHKHGSTEIRIQDNDNKDLMVTSQQSITGGYKTINKPGSTELGIEDNDNTDPMVTDQQPSTLVNTATTTKSTSTFGENDAGRVLTITMGLIGAVACGILIYKAPPMLHQVENMKLRLADIFREGQPTSDGIFKICREE